MMDFCGRVLSIQFQAPLDTFYIILLVTILSYEQLPPDYHTTTL